MPKLPNIEELRNKLKIAPVNTGREFCIMGIVYNDTEGLHALVDHQQKVRLLSGVELYMTIFRGQTQEYTPCLPTLGRLKKTEDQFVRLCQRVAFEDAIDRHPFVHYLSKIRFMGNHFHVDQEGLAQHYGMSTDMIDVSCNFEVASFFATCDWNPVSNRFEPVAHKEPGVIYRVLPHIMSGLSGFDPESDPVKILGWQPLPRPEQQRAFSIKLGSGQDFSKLHAVQKFYFRHNTHISHRIWESFDKGKSLFPHDAAAEIAAQAKKLRKFTQSQVDRSWHRLECWTGGIFDGDTRESIENACGISKTDESILKWEGLDVEFDESKLEAKLLDVCNRVRFRKAYQVRG